MGDARLTAETLRHRGITAMLVDPAIRAVVPPWGGEPAIDLLPLLDFGAISAAEPILRPPTGPCDPMLGAADDTERHRRQLSWLSLAYMTAEGAIAIVAAVLSGSMALLGFGPDSAIEGLASVIIIWRFTGTRMLSATAEAPALRAVAATFFLLAPYIANDAITTLLAHDHAHSSWLGIGLSISSLTVMPSSAWPKTPRHPARFGSHRR